MIKLFQFNHDQKILEAYFCFLVYIFTGITDELDANAKSITDPANHTSDKYDLKFLISHFDNAIEQTTNKMFVKIIKKNATTNIAWNFLINQLKLKHLAANDSLSLDQIQFDDE